MGLFDEIVFSTNCPYCNKWQTFIAQTKAFKGRCQYRYAYLGNPKHAFIPFKNDTLPIHDFDQTGDAKHAKRGYILAGADCTSPHCLWYSMRNDIIQFPNDPDPRSWGRDIDVKIHFNKKTGEIVGTEWVTTKQTPEKQLAKAHNTLWEHNPKKYAKAFKQAHGEPLLTLIHYERNETWQLFKPKSKRKTKKEST